MLWTRTLARTAGIALAALALAVAPTVAHDKSVGDLTITHPQARPNLPNRPTAAYMVISNDGETDDRLISASSPAFGTVELHTTMKHGEVMKMMPVDGIDVVAGDSAVLEPGGFHLMLFEGIRAHKIGEEFMLNLKFEKAGDVTVMVKVEKISGGAGHGQHGSDGKMNHGNKSHGTTSD